MAETYCGKSCDACPEKSQLNCPGCRIGPGKFLGGDCTVAKCCVSKYFKSCEECTASSTCFNLRSRNNAAGNRLKKQINAAARQQRLHVQSALLKKWIWGLVFLIIALNVGDLILDALTANDSSMELPSAIINAVFSVCYAFILLKLSPVSSHYRTAAVSMLIVSLFDVIVSLIDQYGLSNFLTFVALIPGVFAAIHEVLGHCDAAEELNKNLAKKWVVLLYWYVGCMCAIPIGGLLMLIGLGLGAFVVIAAYIGGSVVAIVKVVLLCRTAKLGEVYLNNV